MIPFGVDDLVVVAGSDATATSTTQDNGQTDFDFDDD